MPDDLFHAAENAARRLSMSRSELYTQAVADFLTARHDHRITERLNEVYTEQPSAIDPALSEMQAITLRHSPW